LNVGTERAGKPARGPGTGGMVAEGMAERRKSGGRSSSSGSKSSDGNGRSKSSASSPKKPRDSRKEGNASDADQPVRGTAPSAADIDKLEKFEPSEEAKQHEPSKVDAMGQDKRREVVGHSYGPSKRSQIMFFVAVATVLIVIVGGWTLLVSVFDKPPTHFKDSAPWSATPANAALAAEQNVKPESPANPCGEPGNPYPVPAESPCAPPSKANGNQGNSSGE
jgi:hypothetical protein